MGGVGYSVECNVGRLIEVRLSVPRTTNDVLQFGQEVFRAFTAVRVTCVICADWRAASLAPPDVAEALVNLLRRGNGYYERSGMLLSPQAATVNLQVERVCREAGDGGGARRTFRDAVAMRTWLGEILNEAERRRVDEFLAVAPS